MSKQLVTLGYQAVKLRDRTVNRRVTDRRTDVGRSYHYWLWRIYSACVWKDTTFQNIHFYCVHTFNLLLEVFRPRNDLWCVEWDVKLYYTIWKFLSCFRILLYTELLMMEMIVMMVTICYFHNYIEKNLAISNSSRDSCPRKITSSSQNSRSTFKFEFIFQLSSSGSSFRWR